MWTLLIASVSRIVFILRWMTLTRDSLNAAPPPQMFTGQPVATFVGLWNSAPTHILPIPCPYLQRLRSTVLQRTTIAKQVCGFVPRQWIILYDQLARHSRYWGAATPPHLPRQGKNMTQASIPMLLQ